MEESTLHRSCKVVSLIDRWTISFAYLKQMEKAHNEKPFVSSIENIQCSDLHKVLGAGVWKCVSMDNTQLYFLNIRCCLFAKSHLSYEVSSMPVLFLPYAF